MATGYLKFTDGKGESKDKNHVDWSNIMSVQFGSSRPVASGGATSHRSTDRATLHEVVVTKEVDLASLKLLEFSMMGKSIAEVVIELTTSVGEANESTFLKITLNDVLISSFNTSAATGGGGGHHPLETFSLNAAVVKWEYTQYDEKGSKKGNASTGWDVKANAKA